MFRITSPQLWKGLLQNKIVKHAPKITDRNKFWQIEKPIAVKYHDCSFPAIKNAFHGGNFTKSNPNISGSNIRIGKRHGVQTNGRSAIRNFKPVTAREVDTINVYLNYCGYNNAGEPLPGVTPVEKFSEKIIKIESDGMHTGFVMLVAGDYPGAAMRWRIAPHGVKPGDILETTLTLDQEVDELKQGNSHPIGCLPIGTPVCMIQQTKHQIRYKEGLLSEMGMCWKDCMETKNAGSHGFIIKHETIINKHEKEEKYTYIHYPFHHITRSVKVESNAICTVGRVSNPGYLKSMRGITKSQDARWYLGRKVKGFNTHQRVDLRYRRGRAKHGFKPVIQERPIVFKTPEKGFKTTNGNIYIKEEPHMPSRLRYKMKVQQTDYQANRNIGGIKPDHRTFLK